MSKQSAVELAKFVDKGVHVKLSGGREVSGVLKGYDQLLNMVLDEAVEYLRGKLPRLNVQRTTFSPGRLPTAWLKSFRTR
mmetsp:Transcript_5670/g.17108  ORF Transcript_5670/g.17108 Transcript_5670/m.17108 type:complete len:80 (+) Transcript_5670:111-350(+)